MRPYGAIEDDDNRDATQQSGGEDSSVVVYRPYAPDDQPAATYGGPDATYSAGGTDATYSSQAETLPWQQMPDPVLEADEAIVTDVDSGRDLGQDTGDDWIARVPVNPPAPAVPVAPVVPVPHIAPVTSVAQVLGADDATFTADVDADAGASASDDVIIPDDPDAIRAGIEQTRAEMSSTINAIQEKLNPQVLMDQAKDTLQDAASNIISTAKDSVREATVGRVEDMVSNVTDTARDTGGNFVQMVKDNPIPAALVGLGLGWLFTRNSGSSSNRGQNYGYYPDYDQGYRGGGGYQPQSYGRQGYSYGASGQGSSGIVEGVTDRIKQNPVPAALAGAGLGWLLMGGGGSGSQPSGGRSYSQYGGNYGSQGSQGGGIGDAVGQVQSKVGDVADEARYRAQEAASTVTDTAGEVVNRVGEVAGQVRNTAGDVAGTVAHTAGDVAGQTGDVVGRFLRTLSDNPVPATLAGLSLAWLFMQSNSQGRYRLNEARHVASDVASQAGDTVGRLAETAGETVGGVAEGVKYQASETQSQFQRMLMENPLAVGAIAVAVGAAVGLTVPETPQEHQLMGAARDKLVDRAQSVAQDTIQRVQEATGDAMQRVEEVAGNVQNTVQDRASEIGQA
ncbi:MAG: DUF3618 domain-containing protein [Chloroflexota bacterium]|nr:DUF3618 domain-containing protein [Chloroflexota bacterium]MDQ5866255.1 DUF3618 domain-containing protein [Chloroflexota bacterium]